MRLAFVISCLEMGGAQRVAVLLIEELRRRGWQVCLIATYSGRTTSFYRIPDGVETHTLSELTGQRRSRTLSRVLRVLALKRLFQEFQPTAIVSFLTDANIATLLASRGLDVPKVVSERSFPPSDKLPFLYRLLRKLCYPRASNVVMQTTQGLGWLRSNIAAANGCVIPNPVVLPLPTAHPQVTPEEVVPSDAKLILAVGRLNMEKGFDLLVEAFLRLGSDAQGWTLAILGDGPQRERLAAMCSGSTAVARVMLPGAVGNVSDWYRRADLFVLSSRYEGFPNSLVEAMAHGCACVSVDCLTGPRDIIEHGVNGILTEPDSPAALSEGIRTAIADDALRLRLGSAAREVAAKYSIGKVTDMWEQHFHGTRTTAMQ